MSIKVMTEVWEHSQQEGGALLVLLALADHANDQGYCWPSVPTLAKKARLSERHVRRILSDLQETGELEIEARTGRSNYYRVVTPRMGGDNLSGVEEEDKKSPLTPASSPPLTPMSGTPDAHVSQTVNNRKSNHKKESEQMFATLAEICDIDYRLTTGEGARGKGALNKHEKELRDAGITPQDLLAFREWWDANDWRGKKGQPPDPHLVRQNWGRFAKSSNGSTLRIMR